MVGTIHHHRNADEDRSAAADQGAHLVVDLVVGLLLLSLAVPAASRPASALRRLFCTATVPLGSLLFSRRRRYPRTSRYLAIRVVALLGLVQPVEAQRTAASGMVRGRRPGWAPTTASTACETGVPSHAGPPRWRAPSRRGPPARQRAPAGRRVNQRWRCSAAADPAPCDEIERRPGCLRYPVLHAGHGQHHTGRASRRSRANGQRLQKKMMTARMPRMARMVRAISPSSARVSLIFCWNSVAVKPSDRLRIS